MGYRFARQGGSKLYNADADQFLNLPSYTMGSTAKLQERRWTALKSLQPGQVLLFTIHGVPDIAHPDYTTTEADLTAFLRFIKEQHFRVIALKDFDKH
ncbi:MAG TPA: hypothetical protein VLC98_16725 [Phnomibacter sp.]|nr:hypothetical protein [Phnomibacter sp.]